MIRAFAMAVVCILPLAAGVDDDWKNLYSQAQRAAAAKDLSQADLIYNKALLEASRFGKDDVRVASTLQGLGNTHRSEKKLAEAEDDLRRAVSIYTTSSGQASPEFADAQFDLAGVLMEEGKYQPALQSIDLLLTTYDRQLGPQNIKTAAALCMQGDSYRMLKKYADAESPLKQCADIRADDGGVSTPEFGEAANSLALVYQHLGRYSDADSYFTFAAKIRETSLGILSPELADTLEAHAVLLRQLGRDAEAKQKERLAAAIRAHAGKK
jgi:tetratricopeptide (TPR) repeat protein